MMQIGLQWLRQEKGGNVKGQLGSRSALGLEGWNWVATFSNAGLFKDVFHEAF
jgi:hypothetical protein